MKGHTTAWPPLPGSGKRVNWSGSILRANAQARFKNKPVSQIKTLVGLSGYVIGKWTKPTAEDICERIVGAGCNAEIEEVPDYSIVNMRTGETAQIRSEEIYDEVIEALIRNGALIDSRQISCACGGFVVDDLSIQRTPGGVTDL